jgi:hypothetical protein
MHEKVADLRSEHHGIPQWRGTGCAWSWAYRTCDNPADRRAKLFRLSDDGKALIHKMLEKAGTIR